MVGGGLEFVNDPLGRRQFIKTWEKGLVDDVDLARMDARHAFKASGAGIRHEDS